MKRQPIHRFRELYGKRPLPGKYAWTLGHIYDLLYDAYTSGYIEGYNTSNAMWKKKAKR